MSNHILIVEDSPTQAMLLQYTLEEHGYPVSVAHNGEEALAFINRRKPTLVVSDVRMPVMDGWQLCRRIKSEDDLKHIPVILLTALSDPTDIVRGLHCGANSFLVKPYQEESLLSRIRYILANLELRSNGNPEVGLEIHFAGQRHFLTPERLQIIDLLLSTFEDLTEKTHDLGQVIKELREAQEVMAQQAQELRALALRDELTGLYNRRGFLTLAQQQLKIARRAEVSMLVFFADVDGLKHINDTFGHPEGDQALIKTAELLTKTFRDSDIVARMGGDEFTVLAIDAPDSSVDVINARLQKHFEDHNSQGNQHYDLWLSVGFARYDPDTAPSLEALLEQADASLYRQKQSRKAA
jgi:two-component system cell cycle response regulator